MTVDHNYEMWCKILNAFCDNMNIPKKLIVRMHSIQSELQALTAMIDLSHQDMEENVPSHMLHNPDLVGVASEALKEHYLRAMSTTFPGITDKRFRMMNGSLAYVVLQLANFDGFPMTQEVTNAWSDQERVDIAKELRPIINAYLAINIEGHMSPKTSMDMEKGLQVWL